VGVAARRADGDLVGAAARLNLPCSGAGGTAGRAEVHGRDTPGICQVCARHIGGDPERAVGRGPLLVVIEVLAGHQDRSALRLDYLRKGNVG
jgi:hypothetical protein